MNRSNIHSEKADIGRPIWVPGIGILILAFIVFVMGCLFGGCESQRRNETIPRDQGAPTPVKATMNIGFVYERSVEVSDWTKAHDRARIILEKALPYVKTDYRVVQDKENPDNVIRNYAEQKFDVIFVTSRKYIDDTYNVAKKYPGSIFMNCYGHRTYENMGIYSGRMYQAMYLAGLAAGNTAKSNIIGFLAPNPAPDTNADINAFTLGARETNPRVTVNLIWTSAENNPDIERAFAISLIDMNADVIAAHQDTPAAVLAAQDRNRYAVGYAVDLSSVAPKAVVVSAVWNWAPLYIDCVRRVREGKWKTGKSWAGIQGGIVDITPLAMVVDKVTADLVSKRKAELVSGKYRVFSGSIRDQTGKEQWYKKNEAIPDEELQSMNWLAEGVQVVPPLPPSVQPKKDTKGKRGPSRTTAEPAKKDAASPVTPPAKARRDNVLQSTPSASENK